MTRRTTKLTGPRIKPTTSAQNGIFGLIIPITAVGYATYLASGSIAFSLGTPLFVLLLIAPSLQATHIYGLFCLAILATGTSLSDSAAAPLITRAIAVTLLLILLAYARKARVNVKPAAHFGAIIALMLVVIGIYHAEYSVLIQASLGLAIILLIGYSGARAIEPRQTLRIWQEALTLYLTAGLVASLAMPTIAFENERLRGLAENANQLGFFAFALFAISTLSKGSTLRYLYSLAIVVPTLILSASRASLLASIVFALASAVLSSGRSRKLLLLIFAALAGIIGYSERSIIAIQSSALFRTGNSRSASLDEALRVSRESPLFGVGFDGLEQIVASSPLRAVAAGGVVALTLFCFAVLTIARASTHSKEAQALFVAGLTHSLFEGWIVSTSGPIILTFLAIFIAATNLPKENATTNEDHPLAEQREHPSGTLNSRAGFSSNHRRHGRT